MNCVNAGNVLVHLFLQAETHYLLTNKKLQYLLIIGQMSRLACGQRLFDDDIRNFKNGFVLDAIGNTFMTGSAIVSGSTKDAALQYLPEGFVLPFTNKRVFEITEMPSDADRQLLIDVFLAFGAYQESTLCSYLNGLKGLRSAPLFSVLPEAKIGRYLVGAVSKEQAVQNPVLGFVREHYRRAQRAAAEKAEAAKRAEMTRKAAQEKQAELERAQKAAAERERREHDLLAAAKLLAEQMQRESEKKLRAEQEAAVEKMKLESQVAIPVVTPQPKVATKPVLEGFLTLPNVVVGKAYTVFVEVSSDDYECHVSVVAVDLNRELPVVRSQVSDRVFGFTFESVASDIKISAVVRKS